MTPTMDRRDFIKKSAMAAAAGVVIASPLGSVVAQESDMTANKQSRKMKVLLINGSPRENGNTARALKALLRTLPGRVRKSV